MSWADDNLQGFDGEFIINKCAGFILHKLNTHMHENVHGEKIDVRTIDKRYANNLINWYWKRFKVLYRPLYVLNDEERRETFEDTMMIKALKKVVNEENKNKS